MSTMATGCAGVTLMVLATPGVVMNARHTTSARRASDERPIAPSPFIGGNQSCGGRSGGLGFRAPAATSLDESRTRHQRAADVIQIPKLFVVGSIPIARSNSFVDATQGMGAIKRAIGRSS